MCRGKKLLPRARPRDTKKRRGKRDRSYFVEGRRENLYVKTDGACYCATPGEENIYYREEVGKFLCRGAQTPMGGGGGRKVDAVTKGREALSPERSDRGDTGGGEKFRQYYGV